MCLYILITGKKLAGDMQVNHKSSVDFLVTQAAWHGRIEEITKIISVWS